MSIFSRISHIFSLGRDTDSRTMDFLWHIFYILDPYDENNLWKGLEKVLRIIIVARVDEVGTQNFYGECLKPITSSLHEIDNFIEHSSSRILRGLSTPFCSTRRIGSFRMGVDKGHSVVDPRGEIWEVEELFVVDAIVFPTTLGVNPIEILFYPLR